ncbi:glycosyltransferase family 2 protein [Planomonospora venezuelensis]|uniref:Cellulose synthase/poly-beta-1,6-N-acetylglucosamine synthase-like glycosyltransferase n=1 Tax=Planomonospora venezuelensis TaxID=1999 RepID=A0A841DCZ8_PLAVE|nr:cellulose synthase catalytic subunit [Planomonospora venezuelensis]MBB5966168.1 cellulose synthase/poly-beta-1,6-N-acetylglucosamine synthase-like glycosyltransferase [Planomonospora venezuelensis]GIN05801.1 glycosyl transferase [Planomonospora venezuelensis]
MRTSTDAREIGRYDYGRFSRLAGALTEPEPGVPYRVRYRSLLAGEPHRVRAVLLMVAALVVEFTLMVWLLLPEHWTVRPDPYGGVPWYLPAADRVMLVTIALIEIFRLVSVVSNVHAMLTARDPVPVTPEPCTRVAFITTCVPGKEPLEMVRATLTAATKIRHDGVLDVWLLDEGDDPEMKALCRELGTRHFSRKGVQAWNRPAGPYRARTKHGNYNSWLAEHGYGYDFFVSVDTDHVPLPEFCERMLGYFRDPRVAFVVGPQVYGNYDSEVTKAAESQQFLFHSLIQRAGNRYGAPMFVGTNNAVRIRALKQIGGLYDSITEDMATGIEFHRARVPETGERWMSVYTPDVLAVGEGPSSWTDFFTQQLRWSRGTYETLLTQFWKAAFRLSPGRLFNYLLMVTFYPMSALNWLLAGLSAILFMTVGGSGVTVPMDVWLMLYGDAALLQVMLYTWNRRHNVSPHEPEGSSGVAGMVMSALSAPIYVASLAGAVLRRPSRFVVTPKGDSASPDRVATFRIHLWWAGIFGGGLLLSVFWTGRTHLVMTLWAVLALAICLGPLGTWLWTTRRSR